MSAPSSQKAQFRPISFVLDTQDGPETVNLLIRPEDFTRVDPSRMNVQQTLGGAFADSFGPGLPTISLSGHTGWRRGSDDQDGEERFLRLKDQVFDRWHALRALAVAQGNDPNDVQLVYADALDNFACVVAPNNFVLRRSRSRPLLLQYQISLTVINQDIDQLSYLQYGAGLDPEQIQALGLDSLTASINEIASFTQDIQNFIDSTIAAPVKSFMQQSQRLFGAVKNAIASVNGVASSVLNVARSIAVAGINIFRTIQAVTSIPSLVRARLMQITGAYTNIFCVLKNAISQRIYYPDYTPLFGSSNCSSTSGGRPMSSLAGVNPFYSVTPTSGPSIVTMSNTAQSSLSVLTRTDPVLAPMTTADLGSNVKYLSDGMAVAA